MELGGIREGVGWEAGGRAAMECGGQEHFPRGQVLATFQREVPHCQPLFGSAGIGTEGDGMTIALRSRRRFGNMLGVNHALCFCG